MDVSIEGYDVLRSDDGITWFLAGQVYGVTSMVDSGLNTYRQSYYYKIQPFDSCGNFGNNSAYHQTIQLKVQADNGYDQLNWNPYLGWPVKHYIIYQDGKQGGHCAAKATPLNYSDSLGLL